MVWLLIFFILLQVADAATTVRFLRNGLAHEGNSVVAWLMTRLGIMPALIVEKLACIAIVSPTAVMFPREPIAVATVALLCAIYMWVVWHNWRAGTR